MAMDNPSYFTIPKSEQFLLGAENPFRIREVSMGASNSCNTPTSPAAPLSFSGSCTPPLSLKLQLTPEKPRNELKSPGTPPGNAYLIPNGGLPSPRMDSNKRSFRSLLRSLSANAACSNDTQSILLGEPRPADIAPPNHCDPFSVRPNRRFTHNRNISLRSCAEIRISEFQQALMKRRAQEQRINQEMFHTMPLPGTGRRRHSIGAYLLRDGVTAKNVIKVTTVPSEVPKMDAPKVRSDGVAVCAPSPADAPPQRRNPITTLHCSEPPLPISTINSGISTTPRKKRPRNHSIKEMESIIVVSCRESPDAELWSDYLLSCFTKITAQRARHHYKTFAMSIEDLTADLDDNPKLKQVSNGKLQLIILCPLMLAHVEKLSEKGQRKLHVFNSDKVLTMLLGVTDDSISEVHRKAFPAYEQWQRMIVIEQDNTFVDNFLGKAVDIMSNKFLKAPTDKASFSIIPKKIKLGQNRVIALLNEPITNDDVITVQVDKKGEILQIHSFKKRNPYTLQFDVPDCCLEVSMLVWIRIEKNGVSCGSRQIKCECRLRELDQILRASDNPLQFMCQTLGFKTTDREQLDSWMLTAFQKNIPPHFNLLASPMLGNMKINSPVAVGVEEYPTLLHFAARFGLEKLCWQLLECPGGEAACATRNLLHLTPADLAQHHGFPHLATVLRGYMQMNEFSNMYYYLKNMSEESPEASNNLQENNIKILNTEHTAESWSKFNSSKANITPINTPDSNRSDPFSDECLHNLENKHSHHKFVKPPESPKVPISPKLPNGEWLYENDMCQMNTSITSNSSVQRAIEHDYLIQPSNRKVEIVNTPQIVRPSVIDINSNKKQNNSNLNSPVTEKLASFKLPPEFFETKNNFNHISLSKNKYSGSASISSRSSHDHITTPTGQDELAEIINDFKNNVFTISEVEKLVMDWRNRNETQQSLKEKQEQLNKMREEYDKLQRRIKEDLKRPTPFERVRKIFSKGKPKNGKHGVTDVKLNGQRPNSGLSIHSVSSSSSGRLSTASGGSLGDSGTQSDNEDAKIFMEMNALPKSPTKTERFILEDYLIPPPPRPLNSNGNQTQTTHHFQGKNQPLPSIPMCHSKQEYLLKSPLPMDTISEKEGSLHPETSLDSLQCVQPVTAPVNRYMTNDVAEHHYMNMSPA